MNSRELRPKPGLFGEVPQELGESWRQQDGVAAQDQVGVLAKYLAALRSMSRSVAGALMAAVALSPYRGAGQDGIDAFPQYASLAPLTGQAPADGGAVALLAGPDRRRGPGAQSPARTAPSTS
nr:hypothetical protein StreXyl84_63950 [Streptomyces sp. Xyl84]